MTWDKLGTSDIIAVMELKRPNMQKDLAKMPNRECLSESKLMISDNLLSFVSSKKEIKFSLKDFIGQMFRLVLMKYIFC